MIGDKFETGNRSPQYDRSEVRARGEVLWSASSRGLLHGFQISPCRRGRDVFGNRHGVLLVMTTQSNNFATLKILPAFYGQPA